MPIGFPYGGGGGGGGTFSNKTKFLFHGNQCVMPFQGGTGAGQILMNGPACTGETILA